MWHTTLVLSFLVSRISAQTWCNKNYLPGQPVVPPGGQFPTPQHSDEALLVFRCTPIINPYLEGETNGGILVEAFTTFMQYAGAEKIVGGAVPESLDVSVTHGGKVLATGRLAVSVDFKHTVELYFSLSSLGEPRRQPYSVDCSASYGEDAQINTTTALSYLPRPSSGSVTKRDLRTGALLVGDLDKPLFPIGFYTSFDNYLASNLSILDDIKDQGFNIVHPVPTFGDLAALERVLDRMELLGLYLVYDMRHTYKNPEALAAEVNMIKSRPNLLLWYTSDEPDGTSEPLNATRIAYDAIYDLDGYHPVSIVLNCADYEFTAYTEGADIVMPDTYTIANDPSFSTKYNTSCTPDFGCCGCDNCQGELEDISGRLDDFASRLDILGWARTRGVWSVPQAFGGEEFWTRPPTGREFAVQAILSINHGARGIMPWIDPTPADIKSVASALAKALDQAKTFIFDPRAQFRSLQTDRVDVGMWSVGKETLLLIANLNEREGEVELPLPDSVTLRELVNYGVERRRFGKQVEVNLEPLGCAILVAHLPAVVFNAQYDELY
ncbi:hypothetical protein FB45DRAFT_918172 [Roridomyces roridus]|uniref:Uncharacterized protein n=1 Tax=Roridomyces roridus TaxID=1738132 RepID=A0AAD7BR54_9AGAR|nr:hypothetical protein FB45DRAFT_918172 [Roridomyces roridus]